MKTAANVVVAAATAVVALAAAAAAAAAAAVVVLPFQHRQSMLEHLLRIVGLSTKVPSTDKYTPLN